MLSNKNYFGLTLEYLTNSPENLYLERKRAKVSLQNLANEIASFANANGGVLLELLMMGY